MTKLIIRIHQHRENKTRIIGRETQIDAFLLSLTLHVFLRFLLCSACVCLFVCLSSDLIPTSKNASSKSRIFCFFSVQVMVERQVMVVMHLYHLIRPVPVHHRIQHRLIHSREVTRKTILLIRHHLFINHPTNLRYQQVVHHLTQVVAVYLFEHFMITTHKNKMNYHSNKVLLVPIVSFSCCIIPFSLSLSSRRCIHQTRR